MRLASSAIRFFVFGLLFLAMNVESTLLAESQQRPNRDLQTKLAEICQKHDLPAMVAATVDANGLVTSECFGVRKRNARGEVELSDRFPLGSCTKSMTATVASVLVEAGKIDWQTTIGEVWPKATEEHIHPELRDVTLDELLSHQSGLPSNISGPEWASFFDEQQSPPLERRRMLKLVLSRAPTETRGKFSYANLGYVVVAAMLETRARQSFESLMQKHVFDPLGMGTADFRSMESASKLEPPLLWGHQSANGTPVDPRSVGAENPTVYAPCGTVHLTIVDYAKYARWHAAGKPEPVLRSQAAFDHLHKPLVSKAPGEKYAGGWICVDSPLGAALTHGGSNTKAYALIWVFPESKFAAIACTNTGQPQAFPACNEMIVHFMTAFQAGQEIARDDDPPSDLGNVSPQRLVGRYQLTPNFIFDVRYQEGRMLVGITNQPTQELRADSPTRWTYPAGHAQLEFHLRGDGPAYALSLHQNGAVQRAERIAPAQGNAREKTSPFSAIRWKGKQPEVRVGKSRRWVELVSIDGIAASDIVSYSQSAYGQKWQKRFEEDLVEVLTGMKHLPGEGVELVVRRPGSSKTRILKSVAMTEANRQAIKESASDR